MLQSGQPLPINNLAIVERDFRTITVRGWSRYLALSNLTKESSLVELATVKSSFTSLNERYTELGEYFLDKEVEFILSYDDGGKA